MLDDDGFRKGGGAALGGGGYVEWMEGVTCSEGLSLGEDQQSFRCEGCNLGWR